MGDNFTNPILQFFAYDHLPPFLQEVSRPFGELAVQMADTLPNCAETSTAFRKLRRRTRPSGRS